LVDSESVHFELWCNVAARHGFAISDEIYQHALVGVPTLDNAIYLVETYKLPIEPAALAAEKEAAAQAYLRDHAFPLLPGAIEALRSFADAGVAVAIVTGASRAVLDATIRAYDLSGLLSATVTQDDVEHGKPDPEPYQRAMRLLDLSPVQCVAFEDSVAGSRSAAAAGVATCAIPQPPFEHGRFAHATFIAGSMIEAAAWAAARFGLDYNMPR
jgi:HAD superfamily hydrolase (TIGR01509 family)